MGHRTKRILMVGRKWHQTYWYTKGCARYEWMALQNETFTWV